MKEGFRQSMAWLHTWAGLTMGWLLFAMFTTGTAAFFQYEITRWMKPEAIAAASPDVAGQAAIAYLDRVAPDAQSWFITLPSPRNPETAVFWDPTKGKEAAETSATLDGRGNVIMARDTRGGEFFYRFHFDLHYIPWYVARYIVGIAAMFMLIAILSGVVTHKKIFVDFFMLRFGKGQRSWLDAHNVTAVFALPFYLMMTYTGLVTLATMYMPWGIAANYKQEDTFFAAVFPDMASVERTGQTAPVVPIEPLMRAATQAWGGAAVGYIQLSQPHDAKATITLTRAPQAAIGARGETMTFAAATGRLLRASRPHSAPLATESVMIGLHAGRYADWGLRCLYFLSGVGGTIMVGTGLILWTVKRRAKLPDPARPHFGFRLVERINIVMIAGLPAGIAAYFLANRLLPVGMASRADWEIHSLFIAWGATLAWVVARPAQRAWVEGLSIAATLFALVPPVNAIMVPRNAISGLLTGDWLFVTFDLMMILLALAFGFAAHKAGRIAMPRPSRRAAAPELLATA